jgi:4-amino-4-deoxy-L-arabinose transferase-like glycosyltransferase
MLVSGDWVTPRLNDVPYFEKPPLVYWSVAASMAVFGSGEAAVRMTGAVFALGGVLLTYAAGRRLFNRAAGLVAAVVLGSSSLYFALSQVLLLDMAVAVLISATLFCFILALDEPAGPKRRGLFYGLYVAAALATLAKGLIGFLLPGAVMFLWLLAFNQWHRLRPLYLPSGVLVFLAVAAPWHLLAAQRNPGWANFYFVHEHWERFTTTQHGRRQPWWFFAPILLLGLFPWTGFLWSALRGLPRPRWRLDAFSARPWFLVVWAAFIFLFFSKSQSKLIPYILPVLPPLALLIGQWFSRHTEVSDDPRLRPGLWTFAGLCWALGLALPAAVFVPRILNDPQQAEALRVHGVVMGLILIVGGIGVAWVMRRHRLGAAFAAMAAVVLAFSRCSAWPGEKSSGRGRVASPAWCAPRPSPKTGSTITGGSSTILSSTRGGLSDWSTTSTNSRCSFLTMRSGRGGSFPWPNWAANGRARDAFGWWCGSATRNRCVRRWARRVIICSQQRTVTTL